MQPFDRSHLKLAMAAWNELCAFNIQREDAARAQAYVPELYHYTTAEGLKGIIEENYLRASSAYFLNDSSEVDYGCRIIKQALNELQQEHRYPTQSLPAR